MSMAKGYWIAHVDVTDPDGYKNYVAANAIPFAKYGAKFLVRGGISKIQSGSLRQRHVVIEFEDYATALACHESPEYQHAAAIRDRASAIDLAIVEGYDGPQPARV
jgi:uncharacterized protein (DUF1330 family)